jgi:hypothetical protein
MATLNFANDDDCFTASGKWFHSLSILKEYDLLIADDTGRVTAVLQPFLLALLTVFWM